MTIWTHTQTHALIKRRNVYKVVKKKMQRVCVCVRAENRRVHQQEKAGNSAWRGANNCVCVCVCERERECVSVRVWERARARGDKDQRWKVESSLITATKTKNVQSWKFSVCVRVCVQKERHCGFPTWLFIRKLSAAGLTCNRGGMVVFSFLFFQSQNNPPLFCVNVGEHFPAARC